MIRTAIVDDERHAREKLAGLLKSYKDITILSECRNGLEAIKAINSKPHDLVFLDIEMPEIDGFRVIENVECNPLPYFVFVTAYSEYAVKAFEVEALDYIHKPLDKRRLQKSIDRFISQKNRGKKNTGYEQKIRSVLREIEDQKEKCLDRFIVKKNGEYFLVSADDMLWVESDGNYIRIFAEDTKYFIRHTLTGFEEYLNDTQFYRISRSVIVNIDWINKIEDHYYGNYMVHMKTGGSLKMSKNYKALLQKFKNF